MLSGGGKEGRRERNFEREREGREGEGENLKRTSFPYKTKHIRPEPEICWTLFFFWKGGG